MPGGVSSPARAFPEVHTPPLFIAEGRGSRVIDVDGNAYVDFMCGLGPALLGHGPEEVCEAIIDQLRRGTTFATCTLVEQELARCIVASTPCLEQLRFVCSGTEAVMSAVRLARSWTSRRMLLKFRGCYHGHADALLARGTKKQMVGDVPSNYDGLDPSIVENTLIARYNDVDDVRQNFERHGSDIAAIIVEPIATNMGLVPPLPGFLEALRRLCNQYGALLIFDEVVSGFRLCFGSVSKLFKVEPDLIIFGKIIGGGTPVGAYGGRAELMSRIAKPGGVFQGGTFAGNALTMAGGLQTLQILARDGFYERLEGLGQLYETVTLDGFARHGLPYGFLRRGSLFSYVLIENKGRCENYDDVQQQDAELFAEFHLEMAKRGFLFPPTIEEPGFISAAHSVDDVHNCATVAVEQIARLRLQRKCRVVDVAMLQ